MMKRLHMLEYENESGEANSGGIRGAVSRMANCYGA